jgi:hypothetical protein
VFSRKNKEIVWQLREIPIIINDVEIVGNKRAKPHKNSDFKIHGGTA